MEVCIDSIESAENAEAGGAIRVELCANLMEGGTTPSLGMLKTVKRTISLPVFAMVRPRGGDFLYTDHEFTVMMEDIKALKLAGADGFVFGILNCDGTVDTTRCQKLIAQASPKPCTFHRAIDMTNDIHQAVEEVISLGFTRVLTSGGENSALEGLPTICELVHQAGDRIIIMPGGGINEKNLERILLACKAKEFHGSARQSVSSNMIFKKESIAMGSSFCPPEFSNKVTDSVKVRRFLFIAKNIPS